MENNDLSIENHLKDLRKQHRLSQEALAEKLGISRQSIISLESGRSMPSLPLAVSMCKFFNSAFEDLFDFSREIGEEMDRIFDNDNENKSDNIRIDINNMAKQPHIAPSELRGGYCGQKECNMTQELGPWRPFREMVSLRDAMDRLFEDSVITPKAGAAMPKIDIKDKKDHIEVKAELPGMKEEEIDVEISDGVMTISGEKKAEEEKEGEGYYYKESHTGTFSRSFTLPGDIKEDKAEAEMKDGVLTIAIPKIAPKKATKVKLSKK